MIIIRNNIIPFPGYKLINLFGVLFVRKKAKIKDDDLNHEAIHSALMREMLWIFYYIWYVIEFLIRLIIDKKWRVAYKNIWFEREAYNHEDDLDYLKNRKWYAEFKE